MDIIALMKKRQQLKKELQLLRENRKPENTIVVPSRQMVLQGDGYAEITCYIETTPEEIKLEAEIMELKTQINRPTTGSFTLTPGQSFLTKDCR